jgi:RNA polymerase sigma-B factor
VASLALVKAIDRFDPGRGVSFTSFAVPTIVGELKRHFRDKGWSVHLPRGLQELTLRVQEAERRLGSQARRSPTLLEIAEYLGLETEQVLEGLEAMSAHHPDSLDDVLESDGEDGSNTRHDTVGAEDDGYALIDTSATLTNGVQRLRKIDREVLALRFRDELTQTEIATRIGISQMQVSRILRRATDQLRQTIEPERSG